MRKKIEMSGETFGKWQVLEYAGKRRTSSLWLCRCECGTLSILDGTKLRSGRSTSCRKCSRRLRNNHYILKNGYGECIVANGKRFIFDLADYDFIKKFTWNMDKDNYVRTDNKGEKISLHRLLMQPDRCMKVDHINHDPSDNRRSNLRLATNQENISNQKLGKNNTSGYKGVYWNKRRKKWAAQIRVQTKNI